MGTLGHDKMRTAHAETRGLRRQIDGDVVAAVALGRPRAEEMVVGLEGEEGVLAPVHQLAMASEPAGDTYILGDGAHCRTAPMPPFVSGRPSDLCTHFEAHRKQREPLGSL
ncbi:unnamed protein product [Phytophthora fragariaefolia]|uniref:Unnamed protein product n=1 Tax=Phytophthora fragariaefolia TaxID=1490495 RepID=A0A9W6Y6P2_9STRA|nr:unnamed protein product [Phytophthora fragariaefolia]